MVKGGDPKFKDRIEGAVRGGSALVVVLGASDAAMDPLLDSLISMNVISKGLSKFLMLGEHIVEYDPDFR